MKNILIIEDDVSIVELVDIHLKDIHCLTTKTYTGKEGLASAMKNKYDYKTIKDFAHIVASLVQEQLPKTTSLHRKSQLRFSLL